MAAWRGEQAPRTSAGRRELPRRISMWLNKSNGAVASLLAVGLWLAGAAVGLLTGSSAQAQQPSGDRQKIVGVWGTHLGRIHLKADGAYEGFMTEYATGQRHAFHGR